MRKLAGCALVLSMPCCNAPVTESELALDRSFRIDATVGGQRGRVLFDTGFTVTTLGAAAADRWALPAVTGRRFEATDAHGVTATVERHVQVGGMKVGETRFAPFEAPVLAFPPGLDVDAVIGRNAMRSLAWIVDVAGGRLHVLNAGNLDRRLAELHPGRTWTVMPLQEEHGSWGVAVELGKERRRATLHLDTGAGATSLPAEVIAQLGLPDGKAERQRQNEAEADAVRRALEEQGLKVSSVSVSSGTGTRSVWSESYSPWFLLDGLQLGRASCESLTVHDSGTRAGLLGADVLGRVVWALDGPRARLLIRDP